MRPPDADPPGAPMPAHNRTETSKAAAKRVRRHAESMNQRILTHLRQNPGGRTRHEIAEDLGMKLQSVCGRVAWLLEEQQVKEPGNKREGRRVVVAREDQT